VDGFPEKPPYFVVESNTIPGTAVQKKKKRAALPQRVLPLGGGIAKRSGSRSCPIQNDV